jgi:hypothetical protein
VSPSVVVEQRPGGLPWYCPLRCMTSIVTCRARKIAIHADEAQAIAPNLDFQRHPWRRPW